MKKEEALARTMQSRLQAKLQKWARGNGRGRAVRTSTDGSHRNSINHRSQHHNEEALAARSSSIQTKSWVSVSKNS